MRRQKCKCVFMKRCLQGRIKILLHCGSAFIVYFKFSDTVIFFRVVGNGLGITEGGDFSHKSSIKDRMLNLAQTPNRSRSAPLLAIPCWWQVLFFDEF